MPRSPKSPELRLDRQSFELIAESIAHIVWLADATGCTDYFNVIGTEYTGFPQQANYGWQWLDLVHGDDVARAQLGWEHATRTATPFELSYRIRRSDGQFRWHAFRALPVRGPDSEILRWIGTADDVHDAAHGDDEATRVERQVSELRAMLEAAQASPSARFGFVERSRRIARVNDAIASAPDGGGPRADRTSGPSSLDGAVARLAPREVAVARMVASGYTNGEIANRLALSLRSIEASRARLRKTLGVRTRAELVRFAHDAGLGGHDGES